MQTKLFYLANEKPETDEACCSNVFAVGADEMVIPYGDYPHPKGMQRLSRQAAERLVSNFRSWAGKLGRAFGGAPVYVGHPDDPDLSNRYPDNRSYGWINDAAANDDGLHLKVKWSDAGTDLLRNAFYKWFSPYWGCQKVGTDGGKAVLEPVSLRSVGLTNNPNIPGLVPLANAKGDDEMREELMKMLGLPPEATDEQIMAAVKALAEAKAASTTAVAEAANEKTTLANEKTAALQQVETLKNEKATLASEKTALETSLANERKARVDAVLDLAVKDGKITAAQRPQWASDLTSAFDTKVVELANVQAVISTVSKTTDLGKRNGPETDRIQKVQMLVNERMSQSGEDYSTAFAGVKQKHPALFEQMKQPNKQ